MTSPTRHKGDSRHQRHHGTASGHLAHRPEAERKKVTEDKRPDAHLRTGDRESRAVRAKKSPPGTRHVNKIIPPRTPATPKSSIAEKNKSRHSGLLHDQKGLKVTIVDPWPRRICTVRGENPEPILREYWKHVLAYVFFWYVVIALAAISHKTICWAPSPCYLPTCAEVLPGVSHNTSGHGYWEWSARVDAPKVSGYSTNMDLSL